MITAFIANVMIFGIIGGLIIFGSYALLANHLLNTPQGSITEWEVRLAKVRAQLPADRVKLEPPTALLLAPFTDESRQAVEKFISRHRGMERAQLRLARLRCWRRFAVLSFIVGFALSLPLNAPLLDGRQPLWQAYPLLGPALGILASIVVIVSFNFPHVDEWNELKAASEFPPR